MDILERDASNELYDRACDLLAAADGMRTAAGRPGSVAAIAATVGCVEAALDALADATAAMRREAGRQLVGGESHAAAQHEFSALVDALRNARDASDAMRERIGPVLTHLTLVD